jgi:DNA polymerase-3 subunit delta'
MKSEKEGAWGGIIGNQRVHESLARISRSCTLGHAYLFSGPDGVGKFLAALAFARDVNCSCAGGEEKCDWCRTLDGLNQPELLVLVDANKTRWIGRAGLKARLGIEGAGAAKAYAETVLSVFERGYLEEPLPAVECDAVFDGFSIVTDHLFGKGSAPSKESYTPAQTSDAIRRGFDRGDLTEREFLLLRELYEYPLSVAPYRGAIHISYVTPRKDWKYTRPIQSFLAVRSLLGGRKVVIVDDAEKMTAQAQNCLLKTLEEPPADSLIILIAHDEHRLFPTIVSRCQRVRFERLSNDEMGRAAAALVGRAGPGEVAGTLGALAENCPGKLLELANTDADERLKSVAEFFTGAGDRRLESAFALSAAIMAGSATHRKKLQAATREGLELVIFWTTEILRARHGLPMRVGGADWARAAGEHAKRFDEGVLLEVSAMIERTMGLVGWNVDMGLALETSLLRAAQRLSARG